MATVAAPLTGVTFPTTEAAATPAARPTSWFDVHTWDRVAHIVWLACGVLIAGLLAHDTFIGMLRL